MNGALITWLPPHELVIVRVPEAGGDGIVTVPVNVNNPPVQAPGMAVRILQFVLPAPGLFALVCEKLITPPRSA